MRRRILRRYLRGECERIRLQPEPSVRPLKLELVIRPGLQIRDDYTSTHHARLLLWGDDWVVQDLDSTNGTYVDGERIDTPTQVPANTPVKVGATTFELR